MLSNFLVSRAVHSVLLSLLIKILEISQPTKIPIQAATSGTPTRTATSHCILLRPSERAEINVIEKAISHTLNNDIKKMGISLINLFFVFIHRIS